MWFNIRCHNIESQLGGWHSGTIAAVGQYTNKTVLSGSTNIWLLCWYKRRRQGLVAKMKYLCCLEVHVDCLLLCIMIHWQVPPQRAYGQNYTRCEVSVSYSQVKQFSCKSVEMSLRVASLDYLGIVAARLRRDAVSSQLNEDIISDIIGQVCCGP